MSLNQIEDARATYTEATKTCKDSIPLWILLADLEVSSAYVKWKNYIHFQKQVAAGNVTKARSVVEKGRLRNPGNDFLWMKAVSIFIQETLSFDKSETGADGSGSWSA